MKTKITILILLSTIAINGKIFSQQPVVILSNAPGWHKIGETTVDFKKERDQILVLGADHFEAIKFKIMDAPVDLRDMDIFYESGDTQKVRVNTPVLPGKESRVIYLKGGERSIKKIEFEYKTLPNRKDEKAHVEIWGYKKAGEKH